MRLVFLSLFAAFIALLAPLSASAVVPSGELAEICKASSPVCRAYVLGGAERFWLLQASHENCKEETDLKALDDLMASVVGKENPFTKKGKDLPAPFALIEHIGEKKLEICSLGMKMSELLDQCDSKTEKDQNLCHAYISGALDMALAVDDLMKKQAHDKDANYQPKPLFCESMNPPLAKMKMTEKEVLAALNDWRKARPDRPSKTPAAQEIINALVMKYPCEKDNLLTKDAPKSGKEAAEKKKSKAEKK